MSTTCPCLLACNAASAHVELPLPPLEEVQTYVWQRCLSFVARCVGAQALNAKACSRVVGKR
eukprot:12033200-Prorocentrum_lima.AAC.1